MSCNILIVEDDAHIARYISTCLAVGNYKSEICADGLAAVERIGKGNLDLISLVLLIRNQSNSLAPSVSWPQDMDRRTAGYGSGGKLQHYLFRLAMVGRSAVTGALSRILPDHG